MQTKYFEDFLIGERIETSGITLTESQIIDFALMYDPQPFHVDTVAASKGPFLNELTQSRLFCLPIR